MREIVKNLRQEFPEGTRVKLIKMDDVQAPDPGTCGTVKHIDDNGTIHVSWDTGGSLGVLYGEDEIQKVHTVEVTCEITYRRAFKLEMSDEDYQTLMDGSTAPIDDLFENVECHKDSDYERDYAVYDFDQQKQLIDWDD